MSSVALQSVDKFFGSHRQGRTQVLFDVSFEAAEGEFVVLLGPSGCGKSTSLRLIAGLEQADAGDILIGGKRVNNVPSSRRELAMVFQSYALFPHMSVEENILFGLKVRRLDKAEQRSRLETTAALLELEDYLERKPANLSGGQRQRVALGRALVSGASLVLMDEPLSNLDAKLRQQMRVELRELQRRLGLTVVYVTHDQVEAMTMADQVVVMREGRVDQSAPPRTLYREPARAEVARFIGSPPMNLLPCRRVDDGVAIEGSGANVPVTGLPRTAPEKMLLGIRPEVLMLDKGEHQLEGAIEAVELLGADQLARVDVGAERPLIARVNGAVPLESGSHHQVGFDAGELRLFDAATGERVPTEAPGDSAR